MGTYAVIDPDGNVVNLVIWDGIAVYDVSPDILVATGDDPNAQVGGTYLDGVFTPPIPPPPPPPAPQLFNSYSPASGATLSLPNAAQLDGQGYGKQYVYLTPAAALAALTLLLPSAPIDGDEHTIVSAQDIAALTLGGNGGTLLNFGAAVAMAAGSRQHVVYSAQLGGWLRV